MDRRKQTRKATDLILNAYQDGCPSLVKCDNISIHGMRVRRILGPRLNRPARIDLEFQLPDDSEVLYVRGKPIYERNEGHVVGVRFLALTPQQRAKVRAYIDGTLRGLPYAYAN